jgi:hypothetical protein
MPLERDDDEPRRDREGEEENDGVVLAGEFDNDVTPLPPALIP